MKSMKKLAFVLTLLAILALAFAACGRDDEDESGSGAGAGGAGAGAGAGVGIGGDARPVETITMVLVTDEMAPGPDNRIARIMEERLGVRIEYELVPIAQQALRIGTLLVADTLPDIIGVTDVNARMTDGGALLRLDEFIDSGRWPNIAEHVAPYRRQLSFVHPNGEMGLYTLPNYNRFYGDPPLMGGVHWGTGFWLQLSVLEWHDFPSLDNLTLERYFELIEEYKAAHPTINGAPTIGFTFPAFSGRVWGMTNPPAFMAGHPNNGDVMVIDGVAHTYAGSDYAREYFRILNDAFHRGLVDPESFTNSFDMYMANLASGRVLGFHDQRWGFTDAHDALIADGRSERTWVGTMPVFPGYSPWYQDRDVLNIHQGFAINAELPRERVYFLLDFIEEILSEEWQILLSWGEEGVDYHVGADGYFYRTPQQRDDQSDPTWRINNRLMAFVDLMPKRQGTLSCGNAYAPGDQPGEFRATLTDIQMAVLDAYDAGTWRDMLNDPPSNPVYYPAWQISLAAHPEARMAQQQMEEAALRFLPPAIIAPAGQFDAMWQAYLNHLATIDLAALENALTEGIQERIRLFSE